MPYKSWGKVMQELRRKQAQSAPLRRWHRTPKPRMESTDVGKVILRRRAREVEV